MVDDDPGDLLEIAARIADGATIDWPALEAAARTPDEKDRVRRLQQLAGIERLHARLDVEIAESSVHDSLLHPKRSGATADPAMPVTWGPLTVIEKTGRGTFGDVYRARDPRLDRDVALKLLRHRDAALASETEVIEEARLMARVRHPNVTTIYGADRIDGRVGLWMEFVDGRTLEEELRERGPFGGEDLRRVGIEIGGALAAVHSAGLLHRDVKAHNVMRARDGRLLLTDFGTGGRVEDVGASDSGPFAGTPLYLAPEVVVGGPATIQSDVYSLGVLLFHLATGTFPVTGKSLGGLRAAHAAGGPAALRRERPELDTAFASAADRALSPRPEDRPQSADAFVRSLQRASVSRRVWVPVSLAGCALAILGLWMAFHRMPVASEAAEQRVLAGDEAEDVLAISSDGRAVAFQDGKTGNLAVRDLPNGARRLLTKSASSDDGKEQIALVAVFSRDGRRLAYSWGWNDHGDYRVSIRLIDRDRPVEAPPIFTSGPGEMAEVFDWSADGRYLAVQIARNGQADVALLPAAGGLPIVLRTLEQRGSSNLVFSPDSRYLAYDHPTNTTTAHRDVSVVSIDTLESHDVVTGPSRDHAVGWSPDGRYVLVVSDLRAVTALWAQQVRDGASVGAPTLLRSGVSENTVGVSADRLFYRTTVNDQTIVVANVDLTTGKETAPATAPLTLGPSNRRRPKWSPNGQWLAYWSGVPTQRQGQMILSVQSIGGDQIRILPLKLGGIWTYSWSPDERSFLTRGFDFERREGTYRVDAVTGDVTPVLLNTDETVFVQAHWARDGRHFYYTKGPSPVGNIEDEVLERDIVSGAERVLFRNRDLRTPDGKPAPAIRDWVVSPDGSHAAGLEGPQGDSASHAVWVVKLGERTARQVYRVDRAPGVEPCCLVLITHNALLWTPDSHAVIVNALNSHAVPQRRELWVVPIGAGEVPRRIETGALQIANDAPAVSPDGRQVAFQAGRDSEIEIRSAPFELPNREPGR